MGHAGLVNLGDGFAGRRAPGPGDGVVWLHGYTLDSSDWPRIWTSLPSWSHCAIDLPGHGASLPLGPGDDLPTVARRLTACLTAKTRHLVAHSFGSIVALQMALERPDAFETIALISPLLGGGPFDRDIWTRYAEVRAAFRTGGHGPHLRERWLARDAALFGGLHDSPELAAATWRQAGRYPWWDLIDDAYRSLWHEPQTLAALSRLTTPTLLFIGGNESRAGQQTARALQAALPACERVDVAGAGHHGILAASACLADGLSAHWTASPRRAAASAGGHDAAGH